MKTFRVVDLRSTIIDPSERLVEANTAEAAASIILGIDLVRGASKNARPVARVYWRDTAKTTNMVRLYARLGALPAPGKSRERERPYPMA